MVSGVLEDLHHYLRFAAETEPAAFDCRESVIVMVVGGLVR